MRNAFVRAVIFALGGENMMPSRSRPPRPRTRPRSKLASFSDVSECKGRGRPKFAIFIRDVPSFEHEPIARRLLAKLAAVDIFPVYYYSVPELLKDKRNLEKIRSLGDRQSNKSKGTVSGSTIARGCNIMLRHLFERAIRSTPELIVIDYMSETLVDAARLSAASRKLNYNVIFLKKKFYEDCDDLITSSVDLIASTIKHQNHAEIWCQSEADKWWHEMERIYLPSRSSFNNAATLVCRSPELLRQPTLSLGLRDRAVEYLERLEQVAHLLDDDGVETNWDSSRTITGDPESEPHVPCRGSEYTLIVVDDFSLKCPGKPRLFEYFMDEFLREKFSFHLIPVGDLVTMPRFHLLLEWFCSRSDMDLMDTYSYLFLDAFNTLYNDEKIVIVDNIHEGIVMSSYYISRAVEKEWEVIILTRDKCWPPSDTETAEQVVSHLKQKYRTDQKCGASVPMSTRNHALGDYFECS